MVAGTSVAVTVCADVLGSSLSFESSIKSIECETAPPRQGFASSGCLRLLFLRSTNCLNQAALMSSVAFRQSRILWPFMPQYKGLSNMQGIVPWAELNECARGTRSKDCWQNACLMLTFW